MKSIHADNLSFEKVTYVDAYTAVTVTCPVHGDSSLKPARLLIGAGCKRCIEGFTDTELFVDRAKAVHGDTFLYDRVAYTTSRASVIIGCKIHGYYNQAPHGHLDGRGCFKCSRKGYDPTKGGYLYYLHIPSTGAYKIGITNLSVNERYIRKEREHFVEVFSRYYADGRKAKKLESWLLKRYSRLKHKGDNPLNSGSTEMFCTDIFNLQKDRLIASGDLVV